jgi:hypothetical protein
MIFFGIRRSRLAWGLLDIQELDIPGAAEHSGVQRSVSRRYFEGFGLTSSSSSACSGFVVDLWRGFRRGREE